MKDLQLCFSFVILVLFGSLILVSCKREVIEKGVKVGGDILEKEIFVANPALGDITAIKVVHRDSLDSKVILIVGDQGSLLVDLNGNVIQETFFDKEGGATVPVFNPETQKFDFLNKGGGWQPVSYIDNTGKTVLSISRPTPNDAALIDVNEDGSRDMVIGSNASGGLVAFNLEGEQIWKKKTSNSFDVEIFTQGETKRIVHTDGDQILVRSRSGELERALQLPFETFEKGVWPGRDNKVIIGMADDSLQAYDLSGNKLGGYPISREGRTATTAEFDNSRKEKFFGAIVSLLASTNRSEFYVFNSQNSLVFHEVIEAKDPAMESLSVSDSIKLLLVGGSGGIVWSYDLK